MGISIVNYSEKNSTKKSWGILKNSNVYPLLVDYSDHRELMAAYFQERQAFDGQISEQAISVTGLLFNSPVASDVQLFCQGLNYADHVAESGAQAAPDEESLIFMKAASSICGPNDSIIRPAGCKLLDYEIELALVLKTDVSKPLSLKEPDLPKYIGGLLLCNDVSARDLMFGAPMMQWFSGKSQRTFCPMGPVLYLMDEEDFQYLYSLELKLQLNGRMKQSAITNQLIHRPAKSLSEISNFANLAAGDCLLTGTPGGVLAGSSLKVGLAIINNMKNDKNRRKKFTKAQLDRTPFLQPGDVLELSIKTADGAIDLGMQRNEIADYREA